MNNTDRKVLAEILQRLEVVISDLNEVYEQEDTKFSNLPDGLQGAPIGEKIMTGLESMSDATADLDNALNTLNELLNA